MNGKFVGHFLDGIVFFIMKIILAINSKLLRLGVYITGLFLTLMIALSLLLIGLQLSVKPLMKEIIRIRCKKKFCFVLKMLNLDFNLKLST